MADLVTSVVGAVLMITFLAVIAAKLGDLPLWIVCLVAIGLMLWAFWRDALLPVWRKGPDLP